MYQQKAQNGYEIVVIGTGESGLCRVHDRHGFTAHTGTYAQCRRWLADRGVHLLGVGKSDTAKEGESDKTVNPG